MCPLFTGEVSPVNVRSHVKMLVDVSSVAVNVPVPVDATGGAGTSLAKFMVALKVTTFVFGPVVITGSSDPPHETTTTSAASATRMVPRFCMNCPRDGFDS